MTDRLERRLPEVLTDISLPRMPDYIDSLLVRTERMPQRAGWTYLERWIPVSTITATLSMRRPSSLRPLLVVALVLALAVAAIAFYAGSHRPLPPLFGPARNGVIVTTNAGGDVVSVNPANDAEKTLIAGPNLCCVTLAPDGQQFAFFRRPAPGADPTALTIANLDGSVVRDVSGDVLVGADRVEFSPAGDQLLLTAADRAAIIDIKTGAISPIDEKFAIRRAAWIGTSGDVLLSRQAPDNSFEIYRLKAGTTSGATLVASHEFAVNAPLLSPDGSKYLYFIWATDSAQQGDLHVFDLLTGKDLAITQEAFDDGFEWENPVWSPDGTKIAAEQYGVSGYNRVAVLSATSGTPIGGHDAVVVGPAFPTGQNGAAIRFSPDGSTLLVTYRHNNETWLLPTDGTPGRVVDWSPGEDMDWQRLAP